MQLALEHLRCGYGARSVTEAISLTVESGEVLCVLGPNGAGKSTLLKSMLGLIPRLGGEILIDHQTIDGWSRRRLARVLGYVPQTSAMPLAFSVRDMVAMGRTAYLGAFAFPSRDDLREVDQVLARLGIAHLAQRRFSELSGGEQQMVLIARALAQTPALLALDEPTANLDLGNQVAVLRQVRQLATRGLGVVMITHAPEQAFLCASKVLLFRRGRPCLFGPIDTIMTEENLYAAYGVQLCLRTVGTRGGRPVRTCIPMLD